MYFQIVYNALRDPMRRALEALIMERQTEGKATFPPFAQQLIERGRSEGKLEGIREGIREGKLEGIREGELNGKRDTLLRLVARAGIALTDDDRARIEACTDPVILDRWAGNVLGAKKASDVLS